MMVGNKINQVWRDNSEMKITCPDCSAQYDLPAGAIGESGRKVQCASCKNSWRAFPEVEVEKPAVDTPALAIPPSAPASVSGGAQAARKIEEEQVEQTEEEQDALFNGDDEEELDAQFKDAAAQADSYEPRPDLENDQNEDVGEELPQENEETLLKRREALQKRHAVLARNLPRHRLRRWVRLVAGVTLMTIALGSYVFRDPMVRAFPELANLYSLIGAQVNVVGLELENVTTVRALRDGIEVLRIQADLKNITSQQVSVPRVHVQLKDADGVLLYEWNATPQVRVLRSSESVKFSTDLSLPPLDAVEIKLGFVEAHDISGS